MSLNFSQTTHCHNFGPRVFQKLWELPQCSVHQKGDMKQVPYGGPCALSLTVFRHTLHGACVLIYISYEKRGKNPTMQTLNILGAPVQNLVTWTI
jgi:hypothetical protein